MYVCMYIYIYSFSYSYFIVKGELQPKIFIHFILYFNKALLLVVVFQILKLHDVWLWSYSTAKYGKFK